MPHKIFLILRCLQNRHFRGSIMIRRYEIQILVPIFEIDKRIGKENAFSNQKARACLRTNLVNHVVVKNVIRDHSKDCHCPNEFLHD